MAAIMQRNQKLLPPNSSAKFVIYQRLGAQTWMQALAPLEILHKRIA
jgi:hypothetical protein